ncbi:MAG: MFS transporter [Comamonadaceae bacterium]|nr:MFS transporter [Comamonadaceae bacterium]
MTRRRHAARRARCARHGRARAEASRRRQRPPRRADGARRVAAGLLDAAAAGDRPVPADAAGHRRRTSTSRGRRRCSGRCRSSSPPSACGSWWPARWPDRFGRYPVILAGVVTYCAAPARSAMRGADDRGADRRARCCRRIGACTCLVGARGMVRDLYAPTEGARLLAGAATIMSFAPLLGPIVGAACSSAFGWRSAFARAQPPSRCVLAAIARRRGCRRRSASRNPRALQPRADAAHLRRGAALARLSRLRAGRRPPPTAALFAFISGSSFVLIRVLGVSATAYGVCVQRRWSPATWSARWSAAGWSARRGLQRTSDRRRRRCRPPPGWHDGAARAGRRARALADRAADVLRTASAHGLIQPPAQAGAVAPLPAQRRCGHRADGLRDDGGGHGWSASGSAPASTAR